MSYVKLPTVIMDHAVGFQTVNQAIDNNAAMKDLYVAKHAIGVDGINTGGYQNPYRAVGRHNDPLIARTTARYIVDTTQPTPTASPVVIGPMVNLSQAVRLGTGLWSIRAVTPQLFGAHASVDATSAVDRKAVCRIEMNPFTGPTIIVSTWNISGAARVDCSFSLNFWTNTI